jgi:hypothetical protein
MCSAAIPLNSGTSLYNKDYHQPLIEKRTLLFANHSYGAGMGSGCKAFFHKGVEFNIHGFIVDLELLDLRDLFRICIHRGETGYLYCPVLHGNGNYTLTVDQVLLQSLEKLMGH